MRTKHLCVLIHVRNIGEAGTFKHVKPSSNSLTDRSKAVFLLWILFAIYVSCLPLSVPGSLMATCWERSLGSLVCDVFPYVSVIFPYGVLD